MVVSHECIDVMAYFVRELNREGVGQERRHISRKVVFDLAADGPTGNIDAVVVRHPIRLLVAVA